MLDDYLTIYEKERLLKDRVTEVDTAQQESPKKAISDDKLPPNYRTYDKITTQNNREKNHKNPPETDNPSPS